LQLQMLVPVWTIRNRKFQMHISPNDTENFMV
jgi:hypothetical protein